MIAFIRALIRFVLFILIAMSLMLGLSIVSLFTGNQPMRNLRWRRAFVRPLSKILGVKVIRYGNLPSQPALFISNHRSYFDPVAVIADELVMPVAKSEVSKWPLIGAVVRLSGALFVVREDVDQRRATRNAIREKIKEGYNVLIYPEGTTHIEPQCIPFKKGTFIMAADVEIPVVPIAIDYLDIKDAWIGDDTFIRHFFECFGKRNTIIKLSYGDPLISDDPAILRQSAQNWINEQLLSFRSNW